MHNTIQPLEQQLYDIYGMIYVPWWRTAWFYWLCGALVCITIATIVYGLLRIYRARFYRRTPSDSALRALDALEKKHMHAEQSRLFYYTLTDLLKVYLQERYGYRLSNKTDEECIAYFATTDFPHELQELVAMLLRAGTMSKFADAQATMSEMRTHADQARYLIKQTIAQSRS